MGVAVADRDTRVNLSAAGNPGEVDTDRPLGRVADAHQGGSLLPGPQEILEGHQEVLEGPLQTPEGPLAHPHPRGGVPGGHGHLHHLRGTGENRLRQDTEAPAVQEQGMTNFDRNYTKSSNKYSTLKKLFLGKV